MTDPQRFMRRLLAAVGDTKGATGVYSCSDA